jgi:hypothetical protein
MKSGNLRFLHDDVQVQVRSANEILTVLKDDFSPLLAKVQGGEREKLEEGMRRLASIASVLAKNAATTGRTLGEFVRDARE